MSFVAPAFLGLLALGILIVLFHVQQRRRLTVPSLTLWRRLVPHAAAARTALKPPRPSLLLLLQLLALALLALALAQPLLGAATAPQHSIFVLDATASMRAAMPEGGQRFDLARAEALRLVERAGADSGRRVSLIVATPDPHVAVARLREGGEAAVAALAAAEPADTATDWGAVARLAGSLVTGGERTELVLLGDGADPQATASLAAVSGASFSERRFGVPVANAAISAELAPVPDRPGRFHLSGSVQLSGAARPLVVHVAFAGEDSSIPLEIARLDLPLMPRRASAPADAPLTVPFRTEFDLPAAGIVTATLEPDGAQFDDRAAFVVRTLPKIRHVVYVGERNEPLQRALQAVANISVSNADAVPTDLANVDLLVLDDVEVAEKPATNTLWVEGAHVAGAAAPAAQPAGDIDGWRNDHPLSRGIFWGALTVDSTRALVPWPGAERLVEAEGVPLVEALTDADGRQVRIAFDPAQSNWPTDPSFPVFINNVVNWLGPQGGAVDIACTAGAPCPIDARAYGGQLLAVETGDDVRAAPVTLPAPGAAFRPQRAGLYRVGEGGDLIAVNAPVGPESMLETPAAAAVPAPLAEVLTLPLWPLAILAALLILLLEALVAGRGAEGFLRRAALTARTSFAAKRRWLLGLRLLTLGLLIAAIVGVPIWLPQQVERIVVILDSPDRDAPAALVDRLRTEAGRAGPGQQAAVVALGASPVIAADFGGPVAAPPVTGEPSGDLEGALRLAAAMLPPDIPGRLVLAAGAAGAQGDLRSVLPELEARGVRVDAVPLSPPPEGEAAIVMVDAPRSVYAGDTFLIEAMVEAGGPMEAALTVTAGGETIAEQPVSLAKGRNRVEMSIADARPEETLYQFAIAAQDGDLPDNNANGIRIAPAQAPRILVLAPQRAEGMAFGTVLAEQGLDPIVMLPEEAPFQLRDWLDYDGIVLMNVPALSLNTIQQDLIEEVVGEHGRGLAMLGGENSFGPGGYLETALDRMSPLSSRVPRPAPDTAMVFVLDRSGSMNQAVGDITRLDIAKQAAVAATGLLNPQSQVGIVVFDSVARTLLPMQPAGDQDGMVEALTRLDAGGGTDLYPGIELAFEQLKSVSSPIKHVIVLTDGLSQPANYAQLLGAMTGEDITLSVVAIGDGASAESLRTISELGGGAFYETSDFKALPSILSQETMSQMDSPIEERSVVPAWSSRQAEFLAGLPRVMPAVHGYVMTTLKPNADLHLAVRNSEGEMSPLLASWRYGSGRVLALTTHAGGDWTRDWVNIPEYPLLWSQTLRHFLSRTERPGLNLGLERSGDEVAISLAALDRNGQPRSGLRPTATLATTAAPGEPVAATALAEAEAGHYVARLRLPGPGDYRVVATMGEEQQEGVIHIAYPSRLTFSQQSDGREALVAATGGRMLSGDEPLFEGGESRLVATAGWPFWTMTALGLFMVDLILRYGKGLASLLPRRGRAQGA